MKDVASRLVEKGNALVVIDAALNFVLAESYDPVSICTLHYWFQNLKFDFGLHGDN